MGQDIPISVIHKKIASAIDIVIHLGRLRDKSRSVLEICEIVGYDEDKGIILNKLYQYQEKDVVNENMSEGNSRIGKLVRLNNNLINTDKLQKAGIEI